MINVDDSVKEYYLKDHAGQPFSYYVFFRDSGEVKTNSDILEDSLSITESICSSGKFELGLCEASTASFTVSMDENTDGDEITIVQAQGALDATPSYDSDKGFRFTGDDAEIMTESPFLAEHADWDIMEGEFLTAFDSTKDYLAVLHIWYNGDEVFLYLMDSEQRTKTIYHLQPKLKGFDHVVAYNSQTTYNLNRKVKYQGRIYKSLVNGNDYTPTNAEKWEDITARMDIVIPLIGLEFDRYRTYSYMQTPPIYTKNAGLNGYFTLYQMKKPIMPLGVYTVDSCKRQDETSLRNIIAYDRMKAAGLSADVNMSFDEGETVYISDILENATDGTELAVGMNMAQARLNTERTQIIVTDNLSVRTPDVDIVYETAEEQTANISGEYVEGTIYGQPSYEWIERVTAKGSYDSSLYDQRYKETKTVQPKSVERNDDPTPAKDELFTVYSNPHSDSYLNANSIYSFMLKEQEEGDIGRNLWYLDEVNKAWAGYPPENCPYNITAHFFGEKRNGMLSKRYHAHWDYDVTGIKDKTKSYDEFVYGEWLIEDCHASYHGFDNDDYSVSLDLAKYTHFGYKWTGIPSGSMWYVESEAYNKQAQYDKGEITEIELYKGGKTRVYARVHTFSYYWSPTLEGRDWTLQSETFNKQAQYDAGKITLEALYKGGKTRVYERTYETFWKENYTVSEAGYKINGYVASPGSVYFVRLKNPLANGAYPAENGIKEQAEACGTLIIDHQATAQNKILEFTSKDEDVTINSAGGFGVRYISKIESIKTDTDGKRTVKNYEFDSPFLGVSYHSEDEIFNDAEIVVSNADIHTTRRSVISAFLELNGLFLDFDRYGISSYKILEENSTEFDYTLDEIPLISVSEEDFPLVSSETIPISKTITHGAEDLTTVSTSVQSRTVENPVYLYQGTDVVVSSTEDVASYTLSDLKIAEWVDNTYIRCTFDDGTTSSVETLTIDGVLDLAISEFHSTESMEYYVEGGILPPEARYVDTDTFGPQDPIYRRHGYRLRRTETVNGITYKVYQLWTYLYYDEIQYGVRKTVGMFYFPYSGESDNIPNAKNVQDIARQSGRIKIVDIYHEDDNLADHHLTTYFKLGQINNVTDYPINLRFEVVSTTYQIPNYDSHKEYAFNLASNKDAIKTAESEYRRIHFPEYRPYTTRDFRRDRELEVDDFLDDLSETTAITPDSNGRFSVTYLKNFYWDYVQSGNTWTYTGNNIISSWTETERRAVTGRYVYGAYGDTETVKRRFGAYLPGAISQTYQETQAWADSDYYKDATYYVEIEKSDAVPPHGTYPFYDEFGQRLGQITYSYKDLGIADVNGILFHMYNELKSEVVYDSYPSSVSSHWLAYPTNSKITQYKIPILGIPGSYYDFSFPLYERGIITGFDVMESEDNLYSNITISQEAYTFDWEGETPESPWEYEGMEYADTASSPNDKSEKKGAYQIWSRPTNTPVIAETATAVTARYRLPKYNKLNEYAPVFDASKTPVIEAEDKVRDFAETAWGTLAIDRQAEAIATINAYPTTQALSIDDDGFFELTYLSKINYYMSQQGSIIQEGAFEAQTIPLLSCYAKAYNGQRIEAENAMSLHINDNANMPFDGIKILKSSEITQAEEGLYPFYYNDLTKDGISDDMPEVGKWDGNNYYVISENFLISNFVFTRAQLIDICKVILRRIGNLKYYNMTAKTRAMSALEAGDLIIIETADSAYNTAVLRHTMSGDSLITDSIESNFYD